MATPVTEPRLGQRQSVHVVLDGNGNVQALLEHLPERDIGPGEQRGLCLANLFNFFDRAIPSIIIEPIRLEWSLTDFQIGLLGTAFTIVYAIAGLPLGRMADTGSRKKIMGWGLLVWSGLTAVNGAVTSFWPKSSGKSTP